MQPERVEKLTKVMLVSEIVEIEKGSTAKAKITKAIAEHNRKVLKDLIHSTRKTEDEEPPLKK